MLCFRNSHGRLTMRVNSWNLPAQHHAWGPFCRVPHLPLHCDSRHTCIPHLPCEFLPRGCSAESLICHASTQRSMARLFCILPYLLLHCMHVHSPSSAMWIPATSWGCSAESFICHAYYAFTLICPATQHHACCASEGRSQCFAGRRLMIIRPAIIGTATVGIHVLKFHTRITPYLYHNKQLTCARGVLRNIHIPWIHVKPLNLITFLNFSLW